MTHMRAVVVLTHFADPDTFDPGTVNGSTDRWWIWRMFRVVRRLWRLRKLVRQEPYRRVFVNATISPGTFLKLLLILLSFPAKYGGKISIFFHGGRFEELSYLKSRLARSAAGLVFRRVTTAYFLTEEQRTTFDVLFPSVWSAEYQNFSPMDSVPTRSIQNPGKFAALHLLFVGQVRREKGVFELLEAVLKLRRSGCRCLLTIVGDGPQLSELKTLADSSDGEIEFAGPVRSGKLDAFYLAADVLVLPSYSEAMPYVMIEAMRAGLPVVATTVGALDRFIVDGKSGYRIIPGDVPSLIEAIQTLDANRDLLRAIGHHNQEVFRSRLSRSAGEAFYREVVAV